MATELAAGGGGGQGAGEISDKRVRSVGGRLKTAVGIVVAERAQGATPPLEQEKGPRE